MRPQSAGRLLAVPLGIGSLLLMLAGGPLSVAQAQIKDKAPKQQPPAQERAQAEQLQEQFPVFLIGFAGSFTTSDPEVNQQATVVSLTKVGGTLSCPVTVEWRFGLGGDLACTTTSTLGGSAASEVVGTSHDHCTRTLPDSLVRCNVVCDPPLDFYEGKAVIRTTLPSCIDRIAVDARLYHTAEHDRQVTGMAGVKVIRLFTGNFGD